MRYAIIQSGSKQYKAVEGQAIEVERLDLEVGKKLDLTEVLLVSDDENVQVGNPTVDGAKVAATVVAQDKGPKVVIFRYKAKERQRVKTGHRQFFTRLQIDSIDYKGAKPRPAEEKQAEPEAKPAAKRTPRKAAAKKTTAKAAAKKAPAKKTAAKKTAAKKSTAKK